MVRRLGGLLATMAMMAMSASVCAAQECRAPTGLSAGDVRAIHALARRMGLGEPAALCRDLYARPLGIPAIRVEARPIMQGRWRTWRVLWIADINRGADVCLGWRQCPALVREGLWAAAREALETRKTWRIEDADGFVDVSMAEGIKTATVEQLLWALRARRFDDKRSDDFALKYGKDYLNEFLRCASNGRVSVSKDPRAADAFMLKADDGGGQFPMVVLRIVGGRVQWLEAMVGIS